MMTTRSLFLVSVICAVVVAGCGRKQRGVYNFPEKQQVKINKLTLPSVKGLTATAQQKRVTLAWKPLEVSEGVRLVGYHVYRLAQGRFIPKQPITKKPLTSTTHIDKYARRSATKDGVVCYVVRGVFEINDQVIQGLTSQVVAVSLK